MSDSVKTRRYDSSRRREQAEATRHAILRAAHHLFTTVGYAEASIADIAQRAGVAVDTVYATVGRKPRLLLAVHDMALAATDEPLPAERRDYVKRVRAATTFEQKIRLYADALAERLPHTAPLDAALADASATDPDCRHLLKELHARRRANMRLFAADLRVTGRLRPDLSDDQVGDLVWSMNSPEYFRVLTSAGYTPEQYADLVADVWVRALAATEA